MMGEISRDYLDANILLSLCPNCEAYFAVAHKMLLQPGGWKMEAGPGCSHLVQDANVMSILFVCSCGANWAVLTPLESQVVDE